jgi:hypothetical protein
VVRRDGICVGVYFIRMNGDKRDMELELELEPRSHGGLRLSGDLPGRSKN